MSETITLDPSGIATSRTQLDITAYVSATGDGINWGDAEIQAYMADMQVGSSPVDFRLPNRQISIPLILRDQGATSFATINQQLQQKVALLQREGGWIGRTTSGGTLYADVVNATLHLGGDWVQAYRNADVNAVLSLECVPDWYADEVTLDTLSGTTAITSTILQSAGTAVLAGDHYSRCRLVVVDTSGNDQHGLLWGFRARNFSTATTAALSYEAETLTPINGAAATALAGASGGTVINHGSLPAGAWVSTLYSNLTAGAAPMTHQGNYRVWARCYSTTATPQFRLQWGIGALSVPNTNDAVRLPGTAAYYLLDLGSINIQAPPVGTAQWFGVIQAQVDTANDQNAIDRIFFQPLDETAGRLQYTSATPASSITSTLAAGTGANVTGVGSVDWTNPTQITAADSNYATFTSATTSHYLQATSFGFAIPSGATIKGIVASILRSSTDAHDTTDTRVRLVKASVIQTPDKALSTTFWPTTQTWQDYGGATDLWGGSWTPTDINNSGFGVALAITKVNGAATAKVDQVKMTVYYTLASGFTVAQDAVIYASGTVEVRTEGAYRAGTATGVYGPVASQIGDLPRIPTSGMESRPIQVFLKPTRGDLATLADAGLDGLSVQVRVRPSYLYRP